MASDWQQNRAPLKRVTSPAWPGNDLATKHGASSERRWRPIADRLAAELLEERPWLVEHRRTVEPWARVEAQISLLAAYLDDHGLLDADGVPRPAGDRLDRLEAQATRLRSELALSPLSLAKLLGALQTSSGPVAGAIDVEAIQAAGRRFREAHEATQALTEGEPS